MCVRYDDCTFLYVCHTDVPRHQLAIHDELVEEFEEVCYVYRGRHTQT